MSPFKKLLTTTVSPLTLTECLTLCHFDSWDVSGQEAKLERCPSEPKKISIIKFNKKKLISKHYYFNFCDQSSFYLLGLMAKFPQPMDLNPELWGKTIIAVDHKRPILTDGKINLFLAVDLSLKPFRRLSLAYDSSLLEEDFLLLVER